MNNKVLKAMLDKERAAFEERAKEISSVDAALGKENLTVREAINVLYRAHSLGIYSAELWEKAFENASLPVVDVRLSKSGNGRVILEYTGFKVILPICSISSNDKGINYYVVLDTAAATFSHRSITAVSDYVKHIRGEAEAIRKEYLECEHTPSYLGVLPIKKYRSYFKTLYDTLRWHPFIIDDVHSVTKKELRPVKTRAALIQDIVKSIEDRANATDIYGDMLANAINQLEVDFTKLWPRIQKVNSMLEGTPYEGHVQYAVDEDEARSKEKYLDDYVKEKSINDYRYDRHTIFSETIDHCLCIINLPVKAIINNIEKETVKT